MAFSELIQHAGNFGRFQIILVISTFSLIILLSTDNLVENFSAAIPAHRCYVHLLDNITSKSKLSRNLSTEALLRISIPMNANNKQEQCRQFRQTQWQLLNSISQILNEECIGHQYITRWDLVCKSQSLRLWSRSIYLTGYVIGTPAVGYITD
ncbi:solute carrier family 22 member 12-like, partial [Pteropus vampyrus]|uniref:Solute carrier family 22 member 12-like n=1 Tax=Pteropus vampyrus TaxID=132908 RepID=A0A6P3S4P2_PTEVA